MNTVLELLNELKFNWRHCLEIGLLALGLYFVYRAFRSTRGAYILVGLMTVLLAVTLLVYLLDLKVIRWLITRLAAFLAIALVVIFQPELRNALARVGSRSLFSFAKKNRIAFLESLSDTVIKLSNKRYGALFAIERSISLKPQTDTGVILDSLFSSELALSVFHPKASLHDGGMILSNDRVAAAACVFPVSSRELNDRTLGLRHRAALGITEESDAVAIIVSEETGAISVCYDGNFLRNLSPTEFRDALESIFIPKHDEPTQQEPDTRLDAEDPVPDPSRRHLVSDSDER